VIAVRECRVHRCCIMRSPSDGPPSQSPAVSEIAEQVARVSAENARLLERLAESERRFRIISKGVLRVQEAERGRIARDLHDGVGQALTALKIQLELLEQHAGSTGRSVEARLTDLKGLVNRTLQDVKALSHALRPSMLDDLGLVPTLRWLVRTFQKRTGLEVHLACEPTTDERLDPDLETLVYRVTQEALTNAAKYADSPHVKLTLERSGARLRLLVEDHGRGFDVGAALAVAASDRGFGLRAMRDRVQLFGGRFQVTSAPGRGTTIEVEVPL
jgi:two-component system, NarL family, sensor kinase